MASEPKAEAPAVRNPFVDKWLPMPEAWIDSAPPPRQWLLTRDEDGVREGLFPSGKVGMIASAGGVGKTMALSQLALAVATGEDWLGTYRVAKPGKVLLALAEEDAEEVWRRLHYAARVMWHDSDLRREMTQKARQNIVALPLAGEPVALVRYDRPTGGTEELPAIDQLRAQLTANGPWALVILDPLARFAGPDSETDNAAATRFVTAIESLIDVPGRPAIMLAHHTTKASRKGDAPVDATAARGASAIGDGVRWVATMLAERRIDGAPATVVLELAKSNYTAQAPSVRLARDRGGALRLPTPNEQRAIDAARETAKAKGKSKPAVQEPTRLDDSAW